jgi:hypothetical protein
MSALGDLPKGSAIELVLTADDPVGGLKAGARITATWMGEIWHRPTTLSERSIRRRLEHEPISRSECLCGKPFATIEEAERHARLNVPAYNRVRFRYRSSRGEPTARPLSGHGMRITPHYLFETPTLVCQCGWSDTSPYMGLPGPTARAHVREVIAERLRRPDSGLASQ